ncbi:MAG: hypothetical protein ACI8ZM_004106 [Crocinitomix sp.]|jgi:hypothetical protein
MIEMNKSYSIIILLLLLFACEFSINTETTYTSTTNTRIDKTIKDEIKDELNNLNDSLVKALDENDLSYLYKVSSEELIESDSARFEGLIFQFSEVLDTSAYTIFHQTHTKTSEPYLNIAINFANNKNDTADFKLNYQNSCKESVTNLLLVDCTRGQYLVTVIYGKQEGDFIMYYLHMSKYQSNGINLPNYYSLAKTDYEKGELLHSFALIQQAKEVQYPGGDIFRYAIDSSFNALADTITEDVTVMLDLPLTVNQMASSPQIYALGMAPYQHVLFPSITYVTQLNFENDKALANECDEIFTRIDEILPGFTIDFDIVLFSVLSEMPAEGITVQQRNYLKTLKE